MLNRWVWFLVFLSMKLEQLAQDLDTVPIQTLTHNFRIYTLHYQQTTACFDQQFLNLLTYKYIKD